MRCVVVVQWAVDVFGLFDLVESQEAEKAESWGWELAAGSWRVGKQIRRAVKDKQCYRCE